MIARLLAGLLVLAGAVMAQDTAPAAATKSALSNHAFYPISTCIVSGEKLGADAVTFEAGGRTFKTCCDKCKAKIEKDTETFSKKLDEAIISSQLKNYPLDTCVITGKKLGSMGDPIQLVLDGTLVQLCCKGCNKKAMAKAGEMAQKVRDAAFAAQSKTYPLGECLVSGDKLGKDAVSVMVGTQLVKLCCDKCIAKLEKDPATYMAKLQAKPTEAGKDAAPAAKPADKAKGGAMAGDCGGCAGGMEGCESDAKAKPVEKKADAAKQDGSCCETDGKPAAKPADKAKAGTDAAGCGGCTGGMEGCESDAKAKPVEKKTDAAKQDGGCCETDGKPAAKPADKAKAGTDAAGCGGCSGGMEGCESDAKAKPVQKKTDAAKQDGGCCETEAAGAKAKTTPKNN